MPRKKTNATNAVFESQLDHLWQLFRVADRAGTTAKAMQRLSHLQTELRELQLICQFETPSAPTTAQKKHCEAIDARLREIISKELRK